MWEALFISIDVDDYDMPILCLVTRHDKINEDNIVWLLKCDTELRPVMKSTINVNKSSQIFSANITKFSLKYLSDIKIRGVILIMKNISDTKVQ